MPLIRASLRATVLMVFLNIRPYQAQLATVEAVETSSFRPTPAPRWSGAASRKRSSRCAPLGRVVRYQTTETLTPCRRRPYFYGMDWRSRITIEPGKRFGKPCIRGLRITVSDVLEYLASGMTEQQILQDFPDLTREDIRACLAFAADRERKFVSVPPP